MVEKHTNGFVVTIMHPEILNTQKMVFLTEMEAFEYAQEKLSNVIEVLKNEKN